MKKIILPEGFGKRTDFLVMAVSATIALAAAFISDRKGGAE